MDNLRKLPLVTLLTAVALVALNYLPQVQIGEWKARRINILSMVTPEESSIYPVPEVEVPEEETEDIPEDTSATTSISIYHDTSAVKSVIDTMYISVETNSSEYDSLFNADIPEWAIRDYSTPDMRGMAHFCRNLSNPRQDRPVRIAYFGDSFIE